MTAGQTLLDPRSSLPPLRMWALDHVGCHLDLLDDDASLGARVLDDLANGLLERPLD